MLEQLIGTKKKIPYPDTLLLLNFEGSNGQTTAVDSSSYNNHITLSSSASISTANKKFGTSSLYSSESSNYGCNLELPIALETNPFTIEGWWYISSYLSQFSNNMLMGSATYVRLEHNTAGYTYTAVTSGGNNYLYTTDGPAYPINTWVHLAVVFTGTHYLSFQNGTAYLNSPLNVTYTDPSLYFNSNVTAYLDSVRVVKRALYTSNFTPSNSALTLV